MEEMWVSVEHSWELTQPWGQSNVLWGGGSLIDFLIKPSLGLSMVLPFPFYASNDLLSLPTAVSITHRLFALFRSSSHLSVQRCQHWPFLVPSMPIPRQQSALLSNSLRLSTVLPVTTPDSPSPSLATLSVSLPFPFLFFRVVIIRQHTSLYSLTFLLSVSPSEWGSSRAGLYLVYSWLCP
jgi:hypothetical protein